MRQHVLSEVALLSAFKSRLGRTAHGKRQAGIALEEGSFALTLLRRHLEGKPSLDYCTVHHYEGDSEPALKAALAAAGVGGAVSCAVMGSEEYQVAQVEKPEVLPAEMRVAVRWRLRDAVSFDVNEAAVDIFELPEPARHAQQKMLFAVAAKETAVQRIVGAIRPLASGFNAIDIPELCLRNVSALLPQDKKGVAMLALNAKFAQLVVTKQHVLYLTRRIELAPGFDAQSGEDSALDAANLALEIQRSLDYYESHYDQAPIGDLVLAPIDERTQRLALELRNESNLRVSMLDPPELFASLSGGTVADSWLSLMALGAALRADAADA
jgi:MSHA biogenesis protein MshI